MEETLVLGTLNTRNNSIVARVFKNALLETITLTKIGKNMYHMQGIITPISKDDPMFKRLEHAIQTVITQNVTVHFSNQNYQWTQNYMPKIKEINKHETLSISFEPSI